MRPLRQTSYVILGLLSVGSNLTGYDIRKAIQGSVGYFWSESFGQIYPALKQLTAQGLIRLASSKPVGRKKRQEYALTEAGRTRLREWLALPFHNDPPRNEFLLKLFFCREAAPGVAIAHVQDLNERNRRALETLERIGDSVPKDGTPNPHLRYWMLTLSLGKALTIAALEWGEDAMNMLGAQEAPPNETTETKARALPERKRAERGSGPVRTRK